MTIEVRGDDIVLLDIPDDFTVPERFPVRWCTELQAFAVPRRHSSVPSLLKLLCDRGLVEDTESLRALGHRGRIPVGRRAA